MIRDYEPGQRVHARLELRPGVLCRRREAGMDSWATGRWCPSSGSSAKSRSSSRTGNRRSTPSEPRWPERPGGVRGPEGQRRGRAAGCGYPRGARAADHRLRQRGRAGRGRRLRDPRGEIVFTRPIVKEAKLGAGPLAVDADRPRRHLPQARDGRRRVPPRRRDQAARSDVGILPDGSRRELGYAEPGERRRRARGAWRGVPSSSRAHPGALEQEVEVVLPGEADAAEDLEGVVGDPPGGVGGAGLRHRGRERQRLGLGVGAQAA